MSPALIAAAVFTLLGFGVAALLWFPTRAAAAGRLGPNDRWGIRMGATRRSPEVWKHAHRAAFIYIAAAPWIAVISLLATIALAVWVSEGGALMMALLGLCGQIFIGIFGTVFAVIAARGKR